MKIPKAVGGTVLLVVFVLGGCQSDRARGPNLEVSLSFCVESQDLTVRIKNESGRRAYFYPWLGERQGFIEGVGLFFRTATDARESNPLHPVFFSSDALITSLPVRMNAISAHETKQFAQSFAGMLRFVEWMKVESFGDGVFIRFRATFHTDKRLRNTPLFAATPWFRLSSRRLVVLTEDEQMRLTESTIPVEAQRSE